MIGGVLLLVCGGVLMIPPNFVGMGWRAKRSELPSNVQSIFTSELAYEAAFDAFVPCTNRNGALAFVQSGPKKMRDFKDHPGADCWAKLGWSPDGPIRGAYWVVVTPGAGSGTIAVHGICDLDGDGELAEYIATSADPHARLVSDPDIY